MADPVGVSCSGHEQTCSFRSLDSCAVPAWRTELKGLGPSILVASSSSGPYEDGSLNADRQPCAREPRRRSSTLDPELQPRKGGASPKVPELGVEALLNIPTFLSSPCMYH